MGIEGKENGDGSGDETEKLFQMDVGVRSRAGIAFLFVYKSGWGYKERKGR